MTKLIVSGGTPLKGEVTVSGSKNAALPILCAALLTKEKSILKNIPDIADIHAMIKILSDMGAKITFKDHTLEIDPARLKPSEIPNELVKRMRASILIIGGLMARFKEVKMAFPGGCVLGKRSVDAHTLAFKRLGCEIIDDTKGLHLKCKKLTGTTMILSEMSVTATENAVMAAVLAEGESEIRLAAMEPHVQDMCHFLNKMGSKITGIGTTTLKVKGVKELKGITYSIIGDYLEAGTYAIAAVATQGDVMIKGLVCSDLDSFWQKLEEMGANFTLTHNTAHIHPSKNLQPIRSLRTAVFPSFPTDLQAPFTVLLTQAKGVSKVFETLFEGRLNYLFELEKMGAHIEFLNPHQALIIGPAELKPLPISSCDIRAGAAMVIAALVAKGKTDISNISYIDRGYEGLDEKLRALGANIQRG